MAKKILCIRLGGGLVINMQTLRVLSWNILHGGGSRCDQILETIAKSEADIVTLQEFRHGANKITLLEGLAELGLTTVFAPATQTARENSLLIASRLPMQSEVFPAGRSGQVHMLKSCIEVSSSLSLNVIAVHFPQKRAQFPLFEELLELPPMWIDDYSLLIGDFNCGIPLLDSETKTFYSTHLFQQLLNSGWCDAWRELHPDEREYTWISTRKGNGFRYDHVLVSAALNDLVISAEYNHKVRENKISDHSALLVELDCR